MKPIVIVGAGIAGLLCSYRLLQKGYPIILIEKYLIEGGAGVVRDDEDMIIDLMDELDVEYKFWNSGTAIVYNNGEKSEILDYDYVSILDKICKDSANSLSFQYVVDHADIQPLEKVGVLIGTSYSELFTTNSENVCSENDWNEFLVPNPEIQFGKPVRGWKALVQALKDKIDSLGGKVYVDCPVKEIGNDYVIASKFKEKIYYSNVIITTPLHFLQRIKMTSLLNQWYQYANAHIQETNYLRVYSYFDRPFEITKKICTNLPLRRIIPINEHLIMTVYTDGPDATAIYKMHNDEQKLSRYIEEQLEILLERKVPKIKKNWSIFWNKGISSWKPSKNPISEMLQVIQHPAPNIFFCGDTYSEHPGWIEGAMESVNSVLEKF
jgi:hypothetical protein